MLIYAASQYKFALLGQQHHGYGAKHNISPLTVICHIWDLETFPAVSLIGPELYPESLGPGGESNRAFVCLTSLVGCHRIRESCGRR